MATSSPSEFDRTCFDQTHHLVEEALLPQPPQTQFEAIFDYIREPLPSQSYAALRLSLFGLGRKHVRDPMGIKALIVQEL
jgi:hypothetical protein